MSAPASLVYPVQVVEIPISSGDFVEKGNLLLRFQDRDGNIKSIKAPFDCTIDTIVARKNQVFESSAPLLDLREGKAPTEEDIEADLTEIPEQAPAETPTPAPSATAAAGITSNISGSAPATGQPAGIGNKAERPRMMYRKEETQQGGNSKAGTTPGRSSPTSGPSSGKSRIGKRLLVLALYLAAAPILLYLVYSLFGLFPEEELAVSRRPGILFILSHPAIILTSVACFLVPFLVYVYLGQSIKSDRWDKPFLVLNILAIIGSIGLAAPMPFIPKEEYHDYLGHLGVPVDLWAQTSSQPARRPSGERRLVGVSKEILESIADLPDRYDTENMSDPIDENLLVRIQNDCPHQIRVWVRAQEDFQGYSTYGPMLIDGNRRVSFEDEGEVVKHNVVHRMGIYAEIVGKNLVWKISKKGSSFWIGDREIKDAAMMAFDPLGISGDYATYRLACNNFK